MLWVAQNTSDRLNGMKCVLRNVLSENDLVQVDTKQIVIMQGFTQCK